MTGNDNGLALPPHLSDGARLAIHTALTQGDAALASAIATSCAARLSKDFDAELLSNLFQQRRDVVVVDCPDDSPTALALHKVQLEPRPIGRVFLHLKSM